MTRVLLVLEGGCIKVYQKDHTKEIQDKTEGRLRILNLSGASK